MQLANTHSENQIKSMGYKNYKNGFITSASLLRRIAFISCRDLVDLDGGLGICTVAALKKKSLFSACSTTFKYFYSTDLCYKLCKENWTSRVTFQTHLWPVTLRLGQGYWDWYESVKLRGGYQLVNMSQFGLAVRSYASKRMTSVRFPTLALFSL